MQEESCLPVFPGVREGSPSPGWDLCSLHLLGEQEPRAQGPATHKPKGTQSKTQTPKSGCTRVGSGWRWKEMGPEAPGQAAQARCFGPQYLVEDLDGPLELLAQA